MKRPPPPPAAPGDPPPPAAGRGRLRAAHGGRVVVGPPDDALATIRRIRAAWERYQAATAAAAAELVETWSSIVRDMPIPDLATIERLLAAYDAALEETSRRSRLGGPWLT